MWLQLDRVSSCVTIMLTNWHVSHSLLCFLLKISTPRGFVRMQRVLETCGAGEAVGRIVATLHLTMFPIDNVHLNLILVHWDPLANLTLIQFILAIPLALILESLSLMLEVLSSHVDDATALSHAFIDRHKPFMSKMPWENSIMEPIFGDPPAVQPLGMPSSSSVETAQPVPAAEQLEKIRTKATDIDSCVKSMMDRSFIDAKEFDMKRAVGKLSFFLHVGLQASGVGRRLISCPHETDALIRAVVGVESPNTIMKRTNALLSYYRWHSVNMDGNCYPLQEGQLWQYLRSMADDGSAATKASSMVQAVRFAWFILQLDGANECIASRQILGQAEIQLAGKRATWQARSLTVQEVLTIHKTTADSDQNLVTRVMRVHLLLMLYCRCRNSDVAHVQSLMHDAVGDNKQSSCDGFIQFSTRHHKSSRSPESKSLLLPIVGSGVSVGAHNWIEQWVSLRKQWSSSTSPSWSILVQEAAGVHWDGTYPTYPQTYPSVRWFRLAVALPQDNNVILGCQGKCFKRP